MATLILALRAGEALTRATRSLSTWRSRRTLTHIGAERVDVAAQARPLSFDLTAQGRRLRADHRQQHSQHGLLLRTAPNRVVRAGLTGAPRLP